MDRFKIIVAACLAAAAAPASAAVLVTGDTGGGQAFTNMQPSLALGQYIQTQGYYPQRDGGVPMNGTLGQIRTFAYSPGYFPDAAQGQTLPVASNPALYSILGPTYGGDGVSTFGLPNLDGVTMIGAGGGVSPSYSVGDRVGAAGTTLSVDQMPAHTHDVFGGVATGATGGGAAIDNRQPSLAISYGIVANGLFRETYDNEPAVGQIQAFAGDFTPNGLLAANGQLLRIADYSELFAVIGTTYGGDGAFFALPDLRGRTAVGASAVGDASHVTIALGEKTGKESIELTTANLPAHDHDLPAGGDTEDTGSGQAFSTLQPSIGLNYIINLGLAVYPSRGNPMSEYFYIGEVTLFAGNVAPTNWALAQGQLLNITFENGPLFSLLGTKFGGDGVTT